MQFTEAIRIIREFSSANLPLLQVQLVTGFNSLHLQTFLQANLQLRTSTKRATVMTNIYGDLTGSLKRIPTPLLDGCAIALEWPDLDPRLGFRRLGGWGPKELADVIRDVQTRLLEIEDSLTNLPANLPVVLSLPTLDLPPVFHTPAHQLSEAEVQLRQVVNELSFWASGRPNIKLVHPMGDPQHRFDFKGELIAGLPYTLLHADQLARSFAQLLLPSVPKKGLITDLDDTLWAGIAGEVGPSAVSWDLDNQTQLHGLYQQLLRALADQGILLAVASKNDPQIVAAVFQRPDIALPRDRIFPVEVHWGTKADSVTRILETWNLHADSVVFVDDSLSELAEVKAAHPDLDCIRFDGQDYEVVHRLLYRLRDLFAKSTMTEEDGLRRESLRSSAAFRQAEVSPRVSHESFLQSSEAKITFDFAAARNPRSLELVNKTNQFNLNGTRYGEVEWRDSFKSADSFAVNASYCDKYGPLGVVAVFAGQVRDEAVTVSTWVMSCRAFGRRIEYQCLKAILDRFSVPEIVFQFSPTPRNAYLQKFAESFLGEIPTGPFRISRALFLDQCPKLYHEVQLHHE